MPPKQDLRHSAERSTVMLRTKHRGPLKPTTSIPMDVSLSQTETAIPSRADAGASHVEISQYRRRAILAVWTAAALPMAALAWLVAPPLQGPVARAREV